MTTSEAASSAAQPPRFLADANFNRRIIVGLRRRASGVDVVAAHEIGLEQMPDPGVLQEAQRLDRILLTHDVNTMPKHFDALLTSMTPNEQSPVIFLIAQEAAIGVAVQEIYEIWLCSTHKEWRNQWLFLPL